MNFCPSCGFNLTRDEVIERDGFVLDPRGAVAFKGTPIHLTHAEASLLHSVAAANGRNLKRSTIGSRLGEADDPANVASVILCRVRRRFADDGIPCPIKRGAKGYRWEISA